MTEIIGLLIGLALFVGGVYIARRFRGTLTGDRRGEGSGEPPKRNDEIERP